MPLSALVAPTFAWLSPFVGWLRAGRRVAFVAALLASADVSLAGAEAHSEPPASTAALPLKGEPPLYAWNEAVTNAVRRDCTAAALASRQYAILHLALQEASRRANASALLVIVGGEVSARLFPEQTAYLNRVRDALLADLPEKPKPEVWQEGHQIAADVLSTRDGDGVTRSVTYIPKEEPGQWRRTPPFFRPPELPNWPLLKPFSVENPEAYVPAGPPSLQSKDWELALQEVRDLGARESGSRTAYQKESAYFWSDFSYTCTPPGHWNEVAVAVCKSRAISQQEAANLLATVNLAMADAGIVCWKTKYRFNAWRPVTALQKEAWSPLLATPNHPEYPSGHSSFSGAACEVLTSWFGSDACDITVRSDTARKVVRHYTSLTALAKEIGESRIYGGIHFRFSCEDGAALGRGVADEILRKAGKPPFSKTTQSPSARTVSLSP